MILSYVYMSQNDILSYSDSTRVDDLFQDYVKLPTLQNISHFLKFSYLNLFCPKMAATTKMATQPPHSLELVVFLIVRIALHEI